MRALTTSWCTSPHSPPTCTDGTRTIDVLLEQGSTLADRAEFTFAGGQVEEIPTCYYEFAKRYRTSDGRLYQGFVAASADKIFESTNVRGARHAG